MCWLLVTAGTLLFVTVVTPWALRRDADESVRKLREQLDKDYPHDSN